jgi:hypothetical protein
MSKTKKRPFVAGFNPLVVMAVDSMLRRAKGAQAGIQRLHDQALVGAARSRVGIRLGPPALSKPDDDTGTSCGEIPSDEFSTPCSMSRRSLGEGGSVLSCSQFPRRKPDRMHRIYRIRYQPLLPCLSAILFILSKSHSIREIGEIRVKTFARLRDSTLLFCISSFGLPRRFRWNSPSRSAGFQTCCVADFQIGGTAFAGLPAGLEARDTADLAVCATGPTGWRTVPPTENVEEPLLVLRLMRLLAAIHLSIPALFCRFPRRPSLLHRQILKHIH